MKACLFDLDGVIIDSERLYTEFWNGINAIYPLPIPDFATAIKGSTLPEILALYPDEATRADIKERLERFQDTMEFPLMPGAFDYLDNLRSAGVATALVTSSDPRKMERLYKALPELPDLFDVIIDASKVTRSKPDPQGYLLAAEALGAAPQECIVFEDSANGIRAGKASGARVIALDTTLPRAAIEPLASTIISSWSEAPRP